MEDYNKRAQEVLDFFAFEINNGFIVDKGKHNDENALVYIENGHYKGYGYIDNQSSIQSPEDLKQAIELKRYYPDMDDIIRQWLNANRKKVKLIKLN